MHKKLYFLERSDDLICILRLTVPSLFGMFSYTAEGRLAVYFSILSSVSEFY